MDSARVILAYGCRKKTGPEERRDDIPLQIRRLVPSFLELQAAELFDPPAITEDYPARGFAALVDLHRETHGIDLAILLMRTAAFTKVSSLTVSRLIVAGPS